MKYSGGTATLRKTWEPLYNFKFDAIVEPKHNEYSVLSGI